MQRKRPGRPVTHQQLLQVCIQYFLCLYVCACVHVHECVCLFKCVVQVCKQTLTLVFVFFLFFAEAEATDKAEEAGRKTMDSREIRSLLYREEHKPLVRFIYYVLE